MHRNLVDVLMLRAQETSHTIQTHTSHTGKTHERNKHYSHQLNNTHTNLHNTTAIMRRGNTAPQYNYSYVHCTYVAFNNILCDVCTTMSQAGWKEGTLQHMYKSDFLVLKTINYSKTAQISEFLSYTYSSYLIRLKQSTQKAVVQYNSNRKHGSPTDRQTGKHYRTSCD